MKHIASGWERVFIRRVPSVLANLTRNASNLLKAFHQDVDRRASMTGTGVATLPMLEQQLKVYENIFKDRSATTRENINAQQKEINREFVPVITEAMIQGYTICRDERGKLSIWFIGNVVDMDRPWQLRTNEGGDAKSCPGPA